MTSVDTNYTFSGREDDGNGLMYYRNRYYSPTMKRFISEDPIGLNGGINQYAYVGGNPLMMFDPLGLVADIIYFPVGSVGYNAALNINIPGAFVIASHGDSRGLLNSEFGNPISTASVIADIDRNGYKPGQPIYLIACNAGNSTLAQDLADHYHTTVYAAKEYVILLKSGAFFLRDEEWFINPLYPVQVRLPFTGVVTIPFSGYEATGNPLTPFKPQKGVN